MSFEAIAGNVAGAVLGGLMGGGGGSEEHASTTTTSPWLGIQPYLTGSLGIYPQAAALYNRGPQYVAPDPWQFASQSLGLSNAMQTGQTGDIVSGTGLANYLGNQARGNQAMDYALNDALDVRNNPTVQPQIDALQNRMTNDASARMQDLASQSAQTFNLNTLPQIRTGAQSAGQYGGSRQGIAEGTASGMAQQQLARTSGDVARSTQDAIAQGTAGILSNAYNQGVNLYGHAMNLAPSVAAQNLGFAQTGQGMQGAPVGQMASIGQFNRMEDQARTDAPYLALQRYTGSITPFASAGGQTTTPYFTNPMAGAVGGAMGGWQLGGQLGNFFGQPAANAGGGYFGGLSPSSNALRPGTGYLWGVD